MYYVSCVELLGVMPTGELLFEVNGLDDSHCFDLKSEIWAYDPANDSLRQMRLEALSRKFAMIAYEPSLTSPPQGPQPIKFPDEQLRVPWEKKKKKKKMKKKKKKKSI